MAITIRLLAFNKFLLIVAFLGTDLDLDRHANFIDFVDGFRSKGVEAETDIEDRKQFLRKIGY